MEKYVPKFHHILLSARVDQSQLPDALNRLIEKFENAYSASIAAEGGDSMYLFQILAQVDAVICWSISKASSPISSKNQSSDDFVESLVLKAKALQSKWRGNLA